MHEGHPRVRPISGLLQTMGSPQRLVAATEGSPQTMESPHARSMPRHRCRPATIGVMIASPMVAVRFSFAGGVRRGPNAHR